MKNLLIAFLMIGAITFSNAQDAKSKLEEIYNRYANIPNYKVNITYSNVNDRMGFSNTQEGVLVVEGYRYVLKYGENEIWLNDGTTEYVGTKEEDHSQILYFCPGQNDEAIINFGKLTTFFRTDHTPSISGNILSLKPKGDTPYVDLHVEFKGSEIVAIKAVDDFGSAYTYILSNFSTNTSGTAFTINENEYREKIDERGGCK